MYLAKVGDAFWPIMSLGSLESALPAALTLRVKQLIRTLNEAGDDPTMAFSFAYDLAARDVRLR
jgi:hypothetical protein